MGQDSFLDRCPRWLLIAVCVVGVILVGWLMVRVAFPKGVEPAQEAAAGNVVIDFPDGESADPEKNRLDALGSPDRRSSVSDYWSRLEGAAPEGEEGGTAAAGTGSGTGSGQDATYRYEDRYTSLERRAISEGVMSQAQVEARYRQEEEEARESERRRREDEERIARERRRREQEVLSLYGRNASAGSSGAGQAAPAAPAAAPASEPAARAQDEPRRLDMASAGMTLAGDGIISSLDADMPSAGVSGAGAGRTVVPCRVTFLKDERVVSGQRVIMRLMQDLTLSSGTVIPANTHVSGTCTIGDRLSIRISTVTYSNRIHYVAIDAYDADGTEGIYCPVIVDSKAQKAGKNVGREVGSVLSDIVGGVASTANQYLGTVARRGMSEITQSVGSDGTVEVNVSTGYVFYICENLEEDRRGAGMK